MMETIRKGGALPKATTAPTLGARRNELRVAFAVSRDYEPVPGQWYENLEEEESFRVLSVDEDSELLEIEYLDGDIEEIDLEAWHEMDLERIEAPEGWSESDDEDDEAEDDEDWEEEEDDEDEDEDDWDEDEDDADDKRDEY